VCFDNFSTQIFLGDRIAIIGRNGTGKSSLLKMISDYAQIQTAAYIPQIITDFDPSYSGGERFNKAFSIALSSKPIVLLLDEPTNHLDKDNRAGLLKKLMFYRGTLVVVTHEKEILRNYVDILWHIDNGEITIFRGKYDDYIRVLQNKRQSLIKQIDFLKQEKQHSHKNLIKEQEKMAKSKAMGVKKIENKKWMKSVGDLKTMRAEVSQGTKLKSIDQKKRNLSEQLKQIHLPVIIVPKFNLIPQKNHKDSVLSIRNGCIGYEDTIIWDNINLEVRYPEHVAIMGRNGSGKTTLVRGILKDSTVTIKGDWNTPQLRDIGILDQFYKNLDLEKSVIEIISDAAPVWEFLETREHLNAFLFRKNEEIQEKVKNLSGGEKARLSLAQIAANPPKLLILDEITNNLDPETRDHIIQILCDYPGAFLVISHDEDFLNKIKIDKYIVNY
jgi:ATPase subunit of ABC transporter with duplicated ATPase domains